MRTEETLTRTALKRFVLFLALARPASTLAGTSLLDLDFQELVSRADLRYTEAASRSEAGLPVGNGRMGSLVWTTPAALRFQINRVDVFANNAASDSFPERHTDYCGGCGFVDVEFVDYGAALFPNGRTTQHLSCYDGLAAVDGEGVKTRTLVWYEQDVMAVEVSDSRIRGPPSGRRAANRGGLRSGSTRETRPRAGWRG